jgi:hypothetical protein
MGGVKKWWEGAMAGSELFLRIRELGKSRERGSLSSVLG